MRDRDLTLMCFAWFLVGLLICSLTDPMLSFLQFLAVLFFWLVLPVVIASYIKAYTPYSSINWFIERNVTYGQIGEYHWEIMNPEYGPKLMIKISKPVMSLSKEYYGSKDEAGFRLLPLFEYEGVFYNWEDFLQAKANSRFGKNSIKNAVNNLLAAFK